MHSMHLDVLGRNERWLADIRDLLCALKQSSRSRFDTVDCRRSNGPTAKSRRCVYLAAAIFEAVPKRRSRIGDADISAKR